MYKKLTKIQEQIIMGMILGDAHITPHSKKDNKNSIIINRIDCTQFKYAEWVSFILNDFLNKPDLCFNKIVIKSQTHPILNKLKDKLYDKNGTKIITRKFLNNVSPLGIAVWYMNSNCFQLYENTINLTLKENETIKKWFWDKYNIFPEIYKNGLIFENDEVYKLWRLIDKYIIEPMWYKIGDRKDNKIVYLCGPMENVADEGLTWRRKYSKKLEPLGYRCIIPNDEEKDIKQDLNMVKLKSVNIKKYVNRMRDFIRTDLTFVNSSDFLLTKWEGQMSAGTMHEVGYAYQLGKPVYLISSLPSEEIPGWFLACCSKKFATLKDLIGFLKGEK